LVIELGNLDEVEYSRLAKPNGLEGGEIFEEEEEDLLM